MNNNYRLLSAMALAIVVFRVFAYFTVTEPQLSSELLSDCQHCQADIAYHECSEKRALLSSVMPADWAENYMGCQRLRGATPAAHLLACTQCVVWRNSGP